MRFPIDIVFLDRSGKVLKLSRNVKPFKLVAAPLRAYYAVELPSGAISRSETKVGDALTFEDDDEEDASPFRLAA